MEVEQETEATQTQKNPKIILKTGENVDVTFSSDEEGPGGLSSIQEEESSPPEAQNEPTPTPPTPLKFSMPIPKPVEEEPVVMDFEAALGMLKKNKEMKAKKEAEENNEDIEIQLEDEYETIKSSGGRTFRSRPRPPGEDPEAEDEIKTEEINFDEEIEIGELRGLEEDDRIIIVAPKEESTVEASGEENEADEAPESDGSDGPTSETVQGVKIKFKSSAQIPPTMVEEAEMAALDKLEVVTAPLPPMKPEKRDSEPSETEQKIDNMPAPPGEIDEGRDDDEPNLVESWDWEAKESRKNAYPDTESIVSSEVQIITRPKRKEPEQVGLIDLQKSLGDRLLEAYNEEQFIQEELKDIRTMNKQKYLEEKTIMSDERKAQAEKAKVKPKKKSVGFAEPNEENDEGEVIHEPKEESKYLPEAKPKPILKSETVFDEALQGSSFNTPKPQRKAAPKSTAPKIATQAEEEEDEEESSDEEDEESTESEEETETESEEEVESDPYEDDVFAGKGELAGRVSKKYVQPGVPIHPNTDARVIFKFRDPDPQMVAAWRREFRDCSEVQISCGKTLEEEKWDAVMMPMTNSFGWTDVEPEKSFMDAVKIEGNPLPGKIQVDYDGELLVGQSILLNGKKDRNRNCKFVIAAPVMRVPMMIAESVNPYLSMRSAIQQIRKYNMTTRETQRIRTVLFPGLGHHDKIGRMSHHRVAHQMRKAYDLFALEKDVNLVLGDDPGKVVTLHVQMNQYKLGHKV